MFNQCHVHCELWVLVFFLRSLGLFLLLEQFLCGLAGCSSSIRAYSSALFLGAFLSSLFVLVQSSLRFLWMRNFFKAMWSEISVSIVLWVIITSVTFACCVKQAAYTWRWCSFCCVHASVRRGQNARRFMLALLHFAIMASCTCTWNCATMQEYVHVPVHVNPRRLVQKFLPSETQETRTMNILIAEIQREACRGFRRLEVGMQVQRMFTQQVRGCSKITQSCSCTTPRMSQWVVPLTEMWYALLVLSCPNNSCTMHAWLQGHRLTGQIPTHREDRVSLRRSYPA